jgi:hypothetical protein
LKLPFPVPSEVLESAVVGFCDLLQQTPLPVIDAPPSAEIIPPIVAESVDTEATTDVVNVASPGAGGGGGVVVSVDLLQAPKLKKKEHTNA